jgi:hypothetical protein
MVPLIKFQCHAMTDQERTRPALVFGGCRRSSIIVGSYTHHTGLPFPVQEFWTPHVNPQFGLLVFGVPSCHFRGDPVEAKDKTDQPVKRRGSEGMEPQRGTDSSHRTRLWYSTLAIMTVERPMSKLHLPWPPLTTSSFPHTSTKNPMMRKLIGFVPFDRGMCMLGNKPAIVWLKSSMILDSTVVFVTSSRIFQMLRMEKHGSMRSMDSCVCHRG